MVFGRAPWGRWLLLAVVATMGISSGVASVATGGLEGISGHTAFVRGVHFADLPAAPGLPPIHYGLATYQDIKFFGLWTIDRPVQESQDRMVFVWSADAPDPREEPTLVPTGEFARLRDRTGVQWTVYEFSYLQDARLHHAYGVRVGTLHETDDHTIGTEGAYNYVITYRPDRFLRSAAAPIGPDGPATGASDLLPPLAEGVEQALPSDADEADEPSTAPRAPQVAFGLAAVPSALEAHDPAPERRAAPSPPGIPSLPER